MTGCGLGSIGLWIEEESWKVFLADLDCFLTTFADAFTPADAFEKDKTELETLILAEVGPNPKLRLLLE